MYYFFYQGLIDGNLALSYYNRGRIREAIPLQSHDIYSSVKSNNIESAFNGYNLLAKCYIDLKEKHNARLCLDTALTLLNTRLPQANLRMKLLPTLASYYTFASDYKKATEAYIEY